MNPSSWFRRKRAKALLNLTESEWMELPSSVRSVLERRGITRLSEEARRLLYEGPQLGASCHRNDSGG